MFDLPPPPPAPQIESQLQLFIAGDSTAAPTDSLASQGWGLPFSDFFDSNKITIHNRALGGRSSRTFITEGHFDKLAAELRAGDLVLIQFGHNDTFAVNDAEAQVARGSLPGTGGEVVLIDNVLTNAPEVVRSYGSYLCQMIDGVRERGALPIVFSTTPLNLWDDQDRLITNSPYWDWARQVATEQGVPFVDVGASLANDYRARGRDSVRAFFASPDSPYDTVHTSLAGAANVATHALLGLLDLCNATGENAKAVPELSQYLSEQGHTAVSQIMPKVSAQSQ